jgi:hypothetical protein
MDLRASLQANAGGVRRSGRAQAGGVTLKYFISHPSMKVSHGAIRLARLDGAGPPYLRGRDWR